MLFSSLNGENVARQVKSWYIESEDDWWFLGTPAVIGYLGCIPGIVTR